MAQTGYTPIQLYYSSTASAVPLAANLAAGELAINTTDGKLYYKSNGGVVLLLASNATSAPVLSFQTSLSGLTPSTATTGVVTLAGTLGTSSGGTNLTSFTSGGAVYATSTSVLTTGTLPVTAGGTGQTTLATGALGYGQGTSAHASLSIGTAGQVLTVNSGATAPQWTNASSIVGGAAGSNTQIQFNNSGALGASANLTWNGSTLAITGALSATGNLTSLTAQFGTNPAGVSVAVIGIPNQKRIYGRNAANSADINILYVDGNNNVVVGPSDVAYFASTGLTVYGTSTIYKAAGLNTVTELLILDPESGTHVGGKGSKITFKDISVYATGAAIEQARIGVSTGSTLSFRLRDASIAQMILTDSGNGAASLAVTSTSGAGNAVYFRGGTYSDIAYATGIRFLQPAGTTNANRQFRFTSGDQSLTLQGVDGSGTDVSDALLIINPSGGNLAIGATASLSASSGRTDVTVNGTSNAIVSLGVAGVRQGYFYTPSTGIILAAEIGILNLATTSAQAVTFTTSNSEAGRFTSGGDFCVGTTSSSSSLMRVAKGSQGRAFYVSQDAATNIETASIYQTVSGGNNNQPIGLVVAIEAQGTGDRIYTGQYWNGGTPQTKFYVQRDGSTYNATGVYGTISDVRVKQDITDASSQWEDFKKIKFRKFRMIDDIEKYGNKAPYLMGPVAQELEEAGMKGLVETPVDKDGNETDLHKTVKLSIMHMKGMKALQEAMERIEQLEARITAANI